MDFPLDKSSRACETRRQKGMSELGGGIIGLVIGLALLILAVCWICLPFIIISKCNDMITLLREIARPDDVNVRLPQRKTTAAPPLPQSSIFYYDSGDGSSLGPVSIDALRLMQSQGKITGDTQIFSERTQEWCAFRALKS